MPVEWQGGEPPRAGRKGIARPPGPGLRTTGVWEILVLLWLLIGGVLIWLFRNDGLPHFARPSALVLLCAVPLAFVVLIVRGARRRPVLSYSSTTFLSRLRRGIWVRTVRIPAIFRVSALALFAVALARPQTEDRGGTIEVEGIDIVIALDLSKSMEADDVEPNRLEAAKAVLDQFIARRRSDRIGLVVFGKDAYTECPLTLDYSVLRNMLRDIEIGLIDGNATAIGNALGVSLARLRKSDAKSRVVILITDGDNNSGNVTPQEAARYAQAMGVKVFTILIGPNSEMQTVRDAFGRRMQVKRRYPVNPKLLEDIAKDTGGRAFLAADNISLERNFEEILAELDKTTRKDTGSVFRDAYRPFLVIGLSLLLLEAALLLTRLRQYP